MNKASTLHTKWGTASLKRGYYFITSTKEGNKNKPLHRLFYEDFWGVKLPQEIVVHHKDGNKTNNCILNLEAMHITTHSKLHNTGENNVMYNKKHPQEVIEKMSITRSNSNNTTGYYRVYKHKNAHYPNGFIYRYNYLTEDKRRKYISSIDISKLEEKVKSKGLPWVKFNEVEV